MSIAFLRRILAPRSLVLLCAVAFIACSGSTPASKAAKDGGKADAVAGADVPEIVVGSVMGTVDGAPFDLRFERAQNSGDTAMGVYPTIKIALFDAVASRDACIDARVGRSLGIYVTNAVDTTALGAGTYATPDPDAGDSFGTQFAHFIFYDYAAGGLDRNIFGPGSVTLTGVDSSTVTGEFDVTLQANGTEVGHLSGTFSAPVCQ
jgi:hypothetical protein